MNRHVKRLIKVCAIFSPLMLLGAGNAQIYFGTVRSVDAQRITIVQRNGAEKSVRYTADTKAFVSGKLVAVKFVKPHAKVQLALDEHDVCIQVVVDEVAR